MKKKAKCVNSDLYTRRDTKGYVAYKLDTRILGYWAIGLHERLSKPICRLDR